MRKPLLYLLFLGCFAPSLFAQNSDWRSKINPKLWDYTQKPDSAVEFLIIMEKQADVSAAKQLREKADKGKYVFDIFDASFTVGATTSNANDLIASGYSLRVSSGLGQAFFEVIGEDADEQIWRLEIRAADGREVQNLRVGDKGWLKLPDSPSGVYSVLLRHANNQAVAVEKWYWIQDN